MRTRRAKPSISPLGQEGLGGSEGSREGRKEARTDGRREQKILWKSLISLMIHEEAFSPPLLKISLLPPSSSLSSPTEVLGSSPPLKLESQPARARAQFESPVFVRRRSVDVTLRAWNDFPPSLSLPRLRSFVRSLVRSLVRGGALLHKYLRLPSNLDLPWGRFGHLPSLPSRRSVGPPALPPPSLFCAPQPVRRITVDRARRS